MALPRVVAVAVRSPRFCLLTLTPVARRFAFNVENCGAAFLRSRAAASAVICTAPAKLGAIA